MKLYRAATVVFLIVALFALAAPALAAPAATHQNIPAVSVQAEDPLPAVPSLIDALKFLTTAGGIGIAISFLLEQRAWFQKLAPNYKMLAVLAVSIVVPLGAKLLIDFLPPELIKTIEPYWSVVAIGFGSFIGSQWYHTRGNGQTPQG